MQIKIKNRAELLKNISAENKKKRELVFAIIEDVFNRIQPKNLLGNELADKNLKKFKKIVIFAIGKAAKQMADAAVFSLNRKPDVVLIADKGHPFPTLEGMRLTRKMINSARALTEKDLAIVLISGGGSAMFVCPGKGLNLKDKIDITKKLLKSGVPIQELNIVRKHLSQVKGGKFAKLLYPATVWGYAISDVIGNDPGIIASGPITADNSTPADALKILKKYRIKISNKILNYLKMQIITPAREIEFSPKLLNAGYFKKVKLKIIADHFTALGFAQDKAVKLGLKIELANNLLKGEAREIANDFVQNVPEGKIKIGSGETTVTIKGKGFGGRSQEFVLSALKFIKSDQVLAAVGTDGIDGVTPENIAGAVGDQSILINAAKRKLDPDLFLTDNDSYSFFKMTSGLIKTGSTGSNLGDLVILF